MVHGNAVTAWAGGFLIQTKINYMYLHEIVKKRSDLQIRKAILFAEYKKQSEILEKQIEELNRMEQVGASGLDIEKVALSESILYCHGDIWQEVGDRRIGSAAVIDIANDCKHLNERYFGNKVYGSYHQRCDCEYGMGPSHGSIQEEIGLRKEFRGVPLNDEQKDACIYYLRNYKAIKEAKTVTAQQ